MEALDPLSRPSPLHQAPESGATSSCASTCTSPARGRRSPSRASDGPACPADTGEPGAASHTSRPDTADPSFTRTAATSPGSAGADCTKLRGVTAASLPALLTSCRPREAHHQHARRSHCGFGRGGGGQGGTLDPSGAFTPARLPGSPR